MKLLPLLLLAGCASTYDLKVVTDPPGGRVFTKTDSRLAPRVISYTTSTLMKYRDAQGCVQLPEFRVTWVSGAAVEVPSLRVCGDLAGSGEYVVRRPNVPGIEHDIAFAGSLQRDDGPLLMPMPVYNFGPTYRPPQQPRSVYCTTNTIRGSAQTTCTPQ